MKYAQRVELFRHRIEQVIDRSGLKHAHFAQSIGVDRSTISQLLSAANLRLPRADTLVAVAEQYQVSVDWLLGLTEAGSISTDLVAEPLEFEDFSRSTVNQKLLQWHREALHYKVRYVPATLPDVLKTEAVVRYEFRRYGTGKVSQSIHNTEVLLAQQRHEEPNLEVYQSLQDIQGFANGEGVWHGLEPSVRLAQLDNMVRLAEQLYPRFRWFLFDGREVYTAPFTLFGPLRAVVFVGQVYLVLNGAEHIRLFSRRCDDLIRCACVQPHEISDYIQQLIAGLPDCPSARADSRAG